MSGGEIIVEGDAGSFACARMSGGAVFATKAKVVPPAREQMPDGREQAMISRELRIPAIHAMMYRKFGL
jgi:formylmethanofuran dehydrogenase subunit C